MAIDAAALSLQGPRPAMEDSHVLQAREALVAGAVFDGHFGPAVAIHAAATWPDLLDLPLGAALRRLHESSLGLPGGACAVLFQLSGDALRVANVGDAELALVRGDDVEVVTETHRLTNPIERERLLGAGGLIVDPYVIDPATGDGLMPTRSVGDHDFQAIGIVCEPHEWSGTLDSGWLIAACDGLWDVLRPAELPSFLDGSADEVATRLAEEALTARRSYDNLTVIVLHKR